MREVVLRTIGDSYVLDEDFSAHGVLCKKGMVIDGASVPLLWTILIPRMKPKYLASTVIHDKLCNDENYKEADRIFKIMLEEQGVKKWRRFLMYAAVRLWHKYKYGE